MNTKLTTVLAAGLFTLGLGAASAQDISPLNSDSEPDRMDWSELESKFGAFGDVPEGTRVGGVSKTLTNEYWRTLGEGYANIAAAKGVEFVYQAAANEGDQLGQL
ncbi:MAG: ABC transporter substrate-binding protein, partial [Hyphomicrobiales bacterium]